jgi:molybdopterin-synthase adenylyltransferase
MTAAFKIKGMDNATLTRYSRHLLLNEWGIEAQVKLTQAKVLIIGMGGLGCPAAHTLAAAGVGQLTVVDDDVVDATNLQRQYLHTTTRIGMAKVLSAQIALNDINPLCSVIPLQQRLGGEALRRAVAAHDIVLDCSDNFATRHAINRACVHARKPLVSGAAIRFDGQLIVFDVRQASSPCYHCVFPESGPDDDSDRCGVMGVFAPLTQQIGTLQAAAAIKLITSIGSVVLGQLQLFNALDSSTQLIQASHDAACSVCAK